MTIQLTLTELLLTILIIVGIIAVIALIRVLNALLPSVKKLNEVMDDTKEIVRSAKKGTDSAAKIMDNVKTSVNDVHEIFKENKSSLKAATNLINAGTSLYHFIKSDNSKDSGK